MLSKFEMPLLLRFIWIGDGREKQHWNQYNVPSEDEASVLQHYH